MKQGECAVEVTELAMSRVMMRHVGRRRFKSCSRQQCCFTVFVTSCHSCHCQPAASLLTGCCINAMRSEEGGVVMLLMAVCSELLCPESVSVATGPEPCVFEWLSWHALR